MTAGPSHCYEREGSAVSSSPHTALLPESDARWRACMTLTFRIDASVSSETAWRDPRLATALPLRCPWSEPSAAHNIGDMHRFLALIGIMQWHPCAHTRGCYALMSL